MPETEEELSDSSVGDEEGQSLANALFRRNWLSPTKGRKLWLVRRVLPNDKAQYLLPE